jgi:hypothetical protein
MAPPHKDREVVDLRLWGGAMRCQKERFRSLAGWSVAFLAFALLPGLDVLQKSGEALLVFRFQMDVRG